MRSPKKVSLFFVSLVFFLLLMLTVDVSKNRLWDVATNDQTATESASQESASLGQVYASASNTTTPGGRQYYVIPSGSDSNNGLTLDKPFKTIQKAVELAVAGDTINLAPGIYKQDVLTKRNASPTAPITITGPSAAIVKGGGRARVFEINHDYITLSGFTIDGLYGSPTSKNGYRDKLVYALGKETRAGVAGLKILHMTIQNAGGECIRLRYFAQKNEIAYNSIRNCGVRDFWFNGGGKNGEGVYIGTAPEQLRDGKNPTKDPDQSNNNWVHHNNLDTRGNECVDIKESSAQNIVEYNNCTGQLDPESGGMDSRGGSNTFRFNEIYNNKGAGVRLGGDTVGININNNVYSNTIRDNKSGGIKIMKGPQGKICGNIMLNNTGGNMLGDYAYTGHPTATCPIFSSSLPGPVLSSFLV